MGFFNIKKFNIQVEGGGLLEKFKVPNLLKFDGIGDPKAHLRAYLIIMKTIKLKKLLNSLPYHLKGVVPSWYHGLESTICKDQDELVKRTKQQYSYDKT